MSEEYKKVKSGKLKLKGDDSDEKRRAKKKAKKEKKARKRKLNEGIDEDEELHAGWYKAAASCADGNNDGCSHYCNGHTNVCECPSCWILKDDGVTCTPDPAKMAITCDQTGMALELDLCIYTGDASDAITLAFDQQNCTSERDYDNDKFLIETPLDGCATTTSTEGDDIVFKNTISVLSRHNNYGIDLNSDVNIEAQCRFSAFVSEVTSGNYTNSPAVQEVGSSGMGTFEFNADFFTDDDFSQEVDSTDVQVVGEEVFFGMSLATPIDGISFTVDSCQVQGPSYDTTASFDVFKDGCANSVVNNDAVTQDFEVTDQFKLSYHAFQFSGNENRETTEMKMVCHVHICRNGICPISEPNC